MGKYMYHVTKKLEIFALATSRHLCGEMEQFMTEWKSRSEKRRESIRSFGRDKCIMRPLGLPEN